MLFNPHKLGVHKVLQHIPLNALFDIPYKAALKKAVNIADLRTIAKARSHKVRYRCVALRRRRPPLATTFVYNCKCTCTSSFFALLSFCFACIRVHCNDKTQHKK